MIWVKIVCKGYQQSSKVAASKDNGYICKQSEPDGTKHMKIVLACPNCLFVVLYIKASK